MLAVETYLSRQDKYLIITYPRQCQQHLETRKLNVHFLVKAQPRDQKHFVSEEWSIKKIIPITLLGREGQHHPPTISTDNYDYQEETNYEDTRDARPSDHRLLSKSQWHDLRSKHLTCHNSFLVTPVSGCEIINWHRMLQIYNPTRNRRKIFAFRNLSRTF